MTIKEFKAGHLVKQYKYKSFTPNHINHPWLVKAGLLSSFIIMSSLQDLFICRLFSVRRLRFATPAVMQLSSLRDLATATYLFLPYYNERNENTAGVKLCITVCKRSAAYGTKHKTTNNQINK
jgi:hypothetical protein